jgi:hypothetical protein
MSYVTTAVLTVLFTIGFLVLYKLLINPQIVITPSVKNMAKCPDRWNYSITSQMCEPEYKTSCLPFNPNVETLDSALARCNVARTCGTTWSGMCS